jgi:hypothetical protein
LINVNREMTCSIDFRSQMLAQGVSSVLSRDSTPLKNILTVEVSLALDKIEITPNLNANESNSGESVALDL